MAKKTAAENTWYLLSKMEEERLVRDNRFDMNAAQPTSAYAGLYRYEELSDAYLEPATRGSEWHSVEEFDAAVENDSPDEDVPAPGEDTVATEDASAWDDGDFLPVPKAADVTPEATEVPAAPTKRFPRPRPETLPTEELLEKALQRSPSGIIGLRKSAQSSQGVGAPPPDEANPRRLRAAKSRSHSRQKRPWRQYA